MSLKPAVPSTKCTLTHLNTTKRLGVALALVSLVGCANGFITVTPREDKLPKIRIASGYEPCKWSGKIRKQAVKFECKWDMTL